MPRSGGCGLRLPAAFKVILLRTRADDDASGGKYSLFAKCFLEVLTRITWPETRPGMMDEKARRLD